MLRVALGVGVLLLAANGAAQAQSTPKIGFVNLNAILQNAPQIPAINQQLRSEFAARDTEFQSLQEDYNERVQTYERDRDVMSASERSTLERELTQMQRDMERRATELQEDLQIRQNELLNELQVEIVQQVQEYAESNGFDLVVTEAVYASTAINITAAVYEAITGQAPPAPAPAAGSTDSTSE
jgi:outer membrane protein